MKMENAKLVDAKLMIDAKEYYMTGDMQSVIIPLDDLISLMEERHCKVIATFMKVNEKP